MVLDVEGDYVKPGTNQPKQPYFWHEFLLKQAGCTDGELLERRSVQSQLNDEFSKVKNKATRQKRRPEFEAQSRARGLVQSDVFALQLACVQDDDDKLTTAVHMINVANTADGRALPPALLRLFSHKSVVWVNVGVEEDLKMLNRAFFDDSLCDVRFVEAKSLVEAVYGKPLEKRADIQGEGVLGLFQRVFAEKNWTWKKSPLLTRSHWWETKWSVGQIEYALMDVHSIVMIIRELLPKLSQAPGQMASFFPLRRDTKTTAPAKKALVHDSVTAPFAYNDTTDSEDDIFMCDKPSVVNKVEKKAEVSVDDGIEVIFLSSDEEKDEKPVVVPDDRRVVQSDIVEDYRGVLLEDCPSFIDEDDVIDAGGEPAPPPPATEEVVVDVVSKEEFVAPLFSHAENNLVGRIVKMLRASVKINVRTFKGWPNMPLVLAQALANVQRFSAHCRRNLNLVLGHFASRWNEQEKTIFF